MAELFHDVEVQERMEITPEGRAHKVYRLSATTKGGVFFTLEVKEADFNKAKVNELLAARARHIDDIKAL